MYRVGKIKQVNKPSNSVTECIENVELHQSVMESEYHHKQNYIAGAPNNQFEVDPQLKWFRSLYSEFILKRLSKQVELYQKFKDVYTITDGGNEIELVYNTKQFGVPVVHKHTVRIDSWQCTCLTMIRLSIPCRHVLTVRNWKGITPLIPYDGINARWLKSPVGGDSGDPVIRFETEAIANVRPVHTVGVKLTPQAKFCRAREVTDQIASVISQYPDKRYVPDCVPDSGGEYMTSCTLQVPR